MGVHLHLQLAFLTIEVHVHTAHPALNPPSWGMCVPGCDQASQQAPDTVRPRCFCGRSRLLILTNDWSISNWQMICTRNANLRYDTMMRISRGEKQYL
jgi:hypothetical protein